MTGKPKIPLGFSPNWVNKLRHQPIEHRQPPNDMWKEGENNPSQPTNSPFTGHDHHTSSTLIGGNGGAGGPSSLLHPTLEGRTEYVCECKMDVKSTWIPTWHQMDHVSWSLQLYPKLPPRGRPDTKPPGDHGDHGTANAYNRWLFYLIMCEDPHSLK